MPAEQGASRAALRPAIRPPTKHSEKLPPEMYRWPNTLPSSPATNRRGIGAPNASSTRCSSSCGNPPWVLDTIGQTCAAENGGSAIGIMLAGGRPKAWSTPAAHLAFQSSIVATNAWRSSSNASAISMRLDRVVSTKSSSSCRLCLLKRAAVAVSLARLAQGVERAALGVDHEHCRDARKRLCGRIVMRQRPVIGVLSVRVVFVHEAPAVPIDEDPAHQAGAVCRASRRPVAQPANAYAELVGGIGMMETVHAVGMPHVPETSSGSLRHANAVAGIGQRCSRAHRRRPELPLQVFGSLEAAAGEHDGAACGDDPVAAAHTLDLSGIAPQPIDRRAKPDLNAATQHVPVREREHGDALEIG